MILSFGDHGLRIKMLRLGSRGKAELLNWIPTKHCGPCSSVSMTERTSFHPRAPPLPGFGLPLEQDMKDLFPAAFSAALDLYRGPPVTGARCVHIHAFSLRQLTWYSFLALTLRELSMLKFLNQVTDKRDWETKAGFIHFFYAVIAHVCRYSMKQSPRNGCQKS